MQTVPDIVQRQADHAERKRDVSWLSQLEEQVRMAAMSETSVPAKQLASLRAMRLRDKIAKLRNEEPNQ